MHPLFTFPAAYVIDSKGIKAGILVGSILGIIGVSMRLFVNVGGFWTVIVGQVLAGIGRPFILNCQAKISATWFRAEQRVMLSDYIGWYNTNINSNCKCEPDYWNSHPRTGLRWVPHPS